MLSLLNFHAFGWFNSLCMSLTFHLLTIALCSLGLCRGIGAATASLDLQDHWWHPGLLRLHRAESWLCCCTVYWHHWQTCNATILGVGLPLVSLRVRVKCQLEGSDCEEPGFGNPLCKYSWVLSHNVAILKLVYTFIVFCASLCSASRTLSVYYYFSVPTT